MAEKDEKFTDEDTGAGTGEFISAEDLESIDKSDIQQARLKAVNQCYDTPPNKLRELTKLNPYECGNFAMVETWNAKLKQCAGISNDKEPFIGSWAQSFYALRRSVGGKHVEKLRELAEASLMTDTGEDNSKPAWQG